MNARRPFVMIADEKIGLLLLLNPERAAELVGIARIINLAHVAGFVFVKNSLQINRVVRGQLLLELSGIGVLFEIIVRAISFARMIKHIDSISAVFEPAVLGCLI